VPEIRPYQPTDLDALYEICLRTGAAGRDATAMVEDPRLFGELWAAPYGVLEPEHALVLDDGSGRAIGYVLGAVDTRAFEARCALDWWPAAQARHPQVPGSGGLDELLIHLIHHPHAADDEVVARYPSHLHIDLLPEAQGAGWGRQMMDALFALLATDGSIGVHWGVSQDNHPALGFYRHLGATELTDDAMTHRFAWPL
jgi:ribosomal protein S18 acetylase RimI-like enzyme